MSQESFHDVERTLSAVWERPVHLALLEHMEEHEHVSRLAVHRAPSGTPQTVVLKRWRSPGDDRFDPDASASHLFNDWAGLVFLDQVFGDASPAPRVYAGDSDAGFFVVEDLPGTVPMSEALWSSDAARAADALLRYAELLAQVHSHTLGQSEAFDTLRYQLGAQSPPPGARLCALFRAVGRDTGANRPAPAPGSSCRRTAGSRDPLSAGRMGSLYARRPGL